MDFELTDTPEAADIAALADGLEAHAAAFVPARARREIALLVRENGCIVAGLYGATYWDWLHIKLLWVDESLRGQGVGQRLVLAAEAEARQRNCHAAMVDTHSFQAEGFYRQLGYEVFGRLQDFPPGQQRIYLQKRFF